MNVFLSYSTDDWKENPVALGGDPEFGFFPRLEALLRSRGLNETKINIDRYSLKDGPGWDVQLVQMIDAADLFLLLYSPNWLASEFCWKEYQRALRRGNSITILPIWFRRFDLVDAKPHRNYAQLAAELDNEVRKAQTKDFQYDFIDAVGEAYATGDERSTRMRAFTLPYVERIKVMLAEPKMPKTGTVKPEDIRTFKIQVAGQEVDFVLIPAGQFYCKESGQIHTIQAPFLIMQKAWPADQLLANLKADGSVKPTFSHFVPSSSVLPGLSRGLTLPSEDQWDWVMVGAGQERGNALDFEPWYDPVQTLGLIPSKVGLWEPFYGFSEPRRDLGSLSASSRRDVGFKRLGDQKPHRKRAQRNEKPLGSSLLRLVLPATAATAMERKA